MLKRYLNPTHDFVKIMLSYEKAVETDCCRCEVALNRSTLCLHTWRLSNNNASSRTRLFSVKSVCCLTLLEQTMPPYREVENNQSLHIVMDSSSRKIPFIASTAAPHCFSCQVKLCNYIFVWAIILPKVPTIYKTELYCSKPGNLGYGDL